MLRLSKDCDETVGCDGTQETIVIRPTMSKRILLGCYEVPSWGGASTVLYLLFERMQREGMDVAYINLVNRRDEGFFRQVFGEKFSNPRSLDNVHTSILDEPLWQRHGALANLISDLRPDLLFGFGFIAARLLELAAPRLPVVFITSGSRQVKHLVETGAVRDFIGFKESVERGISFPIAADNFEREAVRACDLIIIHSPLVRFAFEHFFPFRYRQDLFKHRLGCRFYLSRSRAV